MTELTSEGKQKNKRYILAPFLYPMKRQADKASHYISWAGWDLFLKKHIKTDNSLPQLTPLLLPDVVDAEKDCKFISEINLKIAEMGSGFIFLPQQKLETPETLSLDIKRYHSADIPNKTQAIHLLDDRAYLALWTLNQIQMQQTREILMEASKQEKRMWAALKGEEVNFNNDDETYTPDQNSEQRNRYAWQCWRRISKDIIQESDIIIKGIPELGD